MIADNRPKLVKKKTPGRNDKCPCGSGKKFKQCCLKRDKVNLAYILKCFYVLINMTDQQDLSFAKGKFAFARRTIEDIPDNWMEKLNIVITDNLITFSIKKEKENIIVTSDRRIIV